MLIGDQGLGLSGGIVFFRIRVGVRLSSSLLARYSSSIEVVIPSICSLNASLGSDCRYGLGCIAAFVVESERVR